MAGRLGCLMTWVLGANVLYVLYAECIAALRRVQGRLARAVVCALLWQALEHRLNVNNVFIILCVCNNENVCTRIASAPPSWWWLRCLCT